MFNKMEIEKLEILKGIHRELVKLNDTMEQIAGFQAKVGQFDPVGAGGAMEVLKAFTDKLKQGKEGTKNGS